MSHTTVIDFVVRPHGSVWTFEPKTDSARCFVGNDLGVQSWQWLGHVFGVDHRLANDLVTALEVEGFVVELSIALKVGPIQCQCTLKLVTIIHHFESKEMNDQTERTRIAEINIVPGSREDLETRYGQVWDTNQLSEEFQAIGFMAPLIVVRRNSDGQKGSLEFQHSPRLYFNWQPHSK